MMITKREIVQLYYNQDELDLDAWKSGLKGNLFIKKSGGYFKYRKMRHQPCWATYNLSTILDVMRKEGGFITDENDNPLFENLTL